MVLLRPARVNRARGLILETMSGVPALPELDGVVFRPFRGRSDYPDFARIITASAKGEGDDRVGTPEGIAASYDHLDRSDPVRDLLVAEVDGEPVAYGRVWWDQEPEGPRVYRQNCFLDPVHGGRGIGSALFRWCGERLQEIADEHVAPEKVREVWSNDRNAAVGTLIRDAGFEPVTYDVEMVRPSVSDLPDHPLPNGLEIRPVTDDQLRAIWEAGEEAFRDHWGYVVPTEAGYARFLAFPYHEPTLWKIAWDDEGVAGQVRSFIDTAQNAEHGYRRGYTEFISTARRWRRRGVAKALIVESIRELASRGMTEVALGVHTENPNGAFDLYSGLGYEVVSTWTTYRKPL
jgi:ribosomal protein S18 acetylase RimI-like enzyme